MYPNISKALSGPLASNLSRIYNTAAREKNMNVEHVMLQVVHLNPSRLQY